MRSGADASELFSVYSTTPSETIGKSLAWAGDLDRDGKADMLLGADRANYETITTAGGVHLISGYLGHPFVVAQPSTEIQTGESVRIEVSGMRDLAGNLMETTSRNVVLFGDQGSPNVHSITQNLWLDASGATLDLPFNEAVDLEASPAFTMTASCGQTVDDYWILDRCP